jgi:hypothetical protein
VGEEFQLRVGTKITGTLTGVSADGFQVKTAYGDIKVPRKDVVTITFPENQPKKEDDPSGTATLPPVDESLKGTKYINHTADFSLSVPTGWRIAPELRASKDIVAALMSQDQVLFFLVTPESFAGNLSTFRVLVENEVQSKLKDYQKLNESEAQLDGKKGIRLVFQGRNAGNNTLLKFLVYVVPYQGRMVRLTFFTLEQLFDDAVPTFEKIATLYHGEVSTGTAKN